MLWGSIKFNVGGRLTIGGIAAIPFSMMCAIGLCKEQVLNDPIFPVLGILSSPVLFYLGCKCTRSGLHTWRNEFIESYNGVE